MRTSTSKGGDAIRIMGIQTQTNKDGVRNVVDYQVGGQV